MDPDPKTMDPDRKSFDNLPDNQTKLQKNTLEHKTIWQFVVQLE